MAGLCWKNLPNELSAISQSKNHSNFENPHRIFENCSTQRKQYSIKVRSYFKYCEQRRYATSAFTVKATILIATVDYVSETLKFKVSIIVNSLISL